MVLDPLIDTGYHVKQFRRNIMKAKPMKIALIIENSQAAKNPIVHEALTAVVEPLGHQVFNYGMYTPEDAASLTLSLIHI